MALGKLADRVGRHGVTCVLCLATVVQSAALAVSWEANARQDALFYLAAVLLGFADCGFQTMPYKLLKSQGASLGDPDEAFVAYKFVQVLACTAGFFCSPLFVTKPAKVATHAQFQQEISLVAAFLALGMLGYFA